MLTFESPFYEIAGVVVFRDHASPTTFHYLAGPPRLTRSEPGNKPNLLLLKYRNALESTSTTAVVREQLGGGFLMFGVDCGLSKDTKDDIIRGLISANPALLPENVSLVPVLYTKGTVNIIALDQQTAVAPEPGAAAARSEFVRGILGTASPSLLQDQRAIFSLSLPPNGATFLEKAYESDFSPIGVMYELEFMGLRPALAVKAHVDMKRVYEQFKLGVNFSVRAGGGTGSTTTPTTTPTTNTPTTGTPTGTGTRTGTGTGTGTGTTPATASGTTAQPAAASGAGTQVFLSADIGYTIEKLKQSGAVRIEIVRQQEGQSVDAMERAALDLLKETILKEFFSPAMTAAPAAMTPATAMTAAQGMMGTTAQTNQGTTGAGTRVELGFQLQWKKEEQLKEAEFDYSVIAPEKRTHAPNGFFSALLTSTERAKHIQEIDLNDAFFRTLDVEVNTTADFALFDLKDIVVEMQYGGTPQSPRVAGNAHFKPTQTNPLHFVAARDQDDFTYRYRTQYSFGQSERIAAQRQSYETPWRTSMSRALVVHPPADVSMLRVFVEPGVVDWEIVDQIETRLTYEDAANQFRTERTFLVKQASTVQEWIVRLTNPALTTYQVQNTWHLKDRSEIAGPSQPMDVAHLYVGDPFVDRLPISIQVVDGSNLARVMIELRYADPAHGLDIRKSYEMEGPTFKAQTITIPIMDVRRREYTYRVVLIKTNGGDETWPEKTTDRLSIIVSEGYVKLDVSVLLIGDLAQNGMDALQLETRGEPLDGDIVRIESHLFDPSSEKRVVERLRLRADRSPRFQFRTTAFRTAGDPLISDWLDHASENLVIQLNRLIPR